MSSLRSENVQLHRHTIDRAARAELVGQQPSVLWFTGLSGSGKSTIANLVEVALHAEGRLTYMLDGDNVRHGLCGDLGFSDSDRVENIRRVTEVSGLMLDAGLIVLVAFISPFRSDRDLARAAFSPGEFFEIHVSTPLAVVEQRDPKGLYARARRGEIKDFTGIDSPYEPPQSPELSLDTAVLSAEQAAGEVVTTLRGCRPAQRNLRGPTRLAPTGSAASR